MNPIKPRHFEERHVKITRTETVLVLDYFFGIKIPWGDATFNDAEFAQALVISAVEASKALGWAERIMTSFLVPPRGVLGAALGLAKFMIATGVALLTQAETDDLANFKVYKMVKDTITLTFKSAATLRESSGMAFKW